MLTQIKEKTLVEYTDEFRINGTGILLGDIKSKIKETAEKYGARCNIDIAEIVSGGWMSSRSTRHCITITHPRYWGCYFGFCITTREYGNFTIVNIYNFGKSDQLKAEAVLQQKTFTGATAGGIAAGVLRGGATGAGFAVGSLVAGTVRGGAGNSQSDRQPRQGAGDQRIHTEFAQRQGVLRPLRRQPAPAEKHP